MFAYWCLESLNKYRNPDNTLPNNVNFSKFEVESEPSNTTVLNPVLNRAC